MKIGEHKGKRAIYRQINNQYTGYVFETITDRGYVLFVADKTYEHFHNANSYFYAKHQELWDDKYTKRCYWLRQSQYDLMKKILL